MKLNIITAEDIKIDDIIVLVDNECGKELCQVKCVDNDIIWSEWIIGTAEVCQSIDEMNQNYKIYRIES